MYCNYPGCTASLKVQFVDDDQEPVVVEVDRVHVVRGGGTHEPSPVARVVETSRWLMKTMIEEDPIRPVK